jgi:hypothetical protein
MNRINAILKFFGIDLMITLNNVKGLGFFIPNYIEFKKNFVNNKYFNKINLFPILTDKYDNSGIANGHYFHQDLLIAQKIYNSNPNKHVDIASRVDGFVAHVASYRNIEVIDIRPLISDVTNLEFTQLDLMSDDIIKFHNYTDSISCLHAIEHFGLGRYGDKIDINGHIKGLDSIYKILKKNGIFYFSTPIGPQRIEFNAHRVFCIKYLLDLFKDRYTINSFSYVDDQGVLYKDIQLTHDNIKINLNCTYGCGIFELKKI